MKAPLIIIVDDNADLVRMLELTLKQDGYRVKGILKSADLFGELAKGIPDLILLDLLMPGMNGFEILDKLKKSEKFAAIPVIMLSGKGENENKVAGLTLGADDYMAKPFSAGELRARIKAVLRRSEEKTGEQPRQLTISEHINIDLDRFEVRVKGRIVSLTSTEFKILECLARHKGRVYDRDEILKALWGDERNVINRTVDVHIRHLRQKLGDAGDCIKNVRGAGYKIDD